MEEFRGFPKIPRLSRECVITEKIDGTNGVIRITEDGSLFVGSRTRWLSPLSGDNHGFLLWAMTNKEELMKLGLGTHFGEWWGSGIQRGYGLVKGDKRFSLFNTSRWGYGETRPKCCDVVPVLYRGIFDTIAISECILELQINGSMASPGFKKPEGIVVYHVAANCYFKKTIEKDESPKGV